MACPHVSGLACSVKTHNPTWSPSAIKSAIMTSGQPFDEYINSTSCDFLRVTITPLSRVLIYKFLN